VDDQQVNVKLAVKILDKLGYTSTTSSALDGKEAVQLITEQKQHFDLILMDRHMPVLDGCSASEQILNYYQLQLPEVSPPIIIAMTASAMEADR
jgi:CheY-like chemotaxis protein